ncbi:hypothetical protein L3X39_08920 [Sabulilitoribacter multivorans]|uniref:DUF4258 domain-containing protein n=1 Tax=Flaviramulus multivorans TaxID=1304750 RepID=A0ABS9IJI4_9FLAO|nr:hypothetical protein [Flaviramulus multivorans]MCF7560759.1 hypothetical protein [Flaviramulus multivorans]
MKLIQRIGYYLGGFSIGLVILAFFLSGKKTSCSYGPEARVLKNINSKTIVYSEDVESLIESNAIDTTIIAYILKKGDINFSKSKTRQKPCGIYVIEGLDNDNDVTITVENCENKSTVLNIIVEK